MTEVVLLDSGPLGLVTQPTETNVSSACLSWLGGLLRAHVTVVIPEIVDYEIRRELLRANKRRGLRRLDSLVESLEYVPLTSPTMKLAAQFWAETRQSGRATTDDRHFDCDVILAAQAELLRREDRACVVATTNIRHLSLFVPARRWDEWAEPLPSR